MSLAAGSKLGGYEILGPIGAGGMGEVYRARDTALGRDVAIKIVRNDLAPEPDRLGRFRREARLLASLNHPNVATIHGLEESGGVLFLVMELVEGESLAKRLARGPIPIDEALRFFQQIAEGLEAAHEKGIIHRDLKPANVNVTPRGRIKILDFGLAKALEVRGEAISEGASKTPTVTRDGTKAGTLVGTTPYMSPEQARGQAVDKRVDIWAFGCCLYETLTGHMAFLGRTVSDMIAAILEREPDWKRLPENTPTNIRRLLEQCLQKDSARRLQAIRDARLEIEEVLVGRLTPPSPRPMAVLPFVNVKTVAAVLLALAGVGWLWLLGADRRWAEHEAIPEITSLVEAGDLYAAYGTALRAAEYLPDHPELEQVLERFTLPFTVNTEPAGADVSVKAYAAPDAPWMSLGVTPVSLRVPYQMMHWRIAKEGYETFEGAPFSQGSISALAGWVLEPAGARPDGTVRIPGGPLERIGLLRPTEFMAGTVLEPYYLERYEVTNQEFQEFVDAGGYRTREWWPVSFMLAHETTWEEAIDRFRDPTGRPGPSTWELGRYPAGRDDYPVGGISWFEAAAYCAFAGRSLPTIYHWFRAIGQEQRSEILVHSNMDGDAKAPVGQFSGMSAYGAYDMAGNVKEWAWNATGDLRYVLGGAWNEPAYLFRYLVPQDPWGREPTNGVRCAQYPEPPDEQLQVPVTPLREFPRPEPIGDEAFQVLRGLYAYDADPLEARVERVDDSHPSYRRETVSIRTAYGDERMEVHLLIPRDVAPPYQSVIWFPGDDVFFLRSSEQFASAWLFDFLPRAGRVVVYPVYRGMYERFEPWERTPNDWRDMVISWGQDIGRTIDYLETRPDFDATKIGYYGFSSGGWYAPVFAAVEPRLAVSMFIGGGLIPVPELHPAMQSVHFAPRSRTPTLMINGRDDFLQPYEAAQRPFFEMLGAPESMKRHARLTGGHIPSDTREIIREVLDWLDLHLGPVHRAIAH